MGWHTIQSAHVHLDTNWFGPYGPFPEGEWRFEYINIPTAEDHFELEPVADTFVSQAAPAENYGSATELHAAAYLPKITVAGGEIENCPELSSAASPEAVCRKDTLLKFDLSGLGPRGFYELKSVKLRLCASSSSTGADVSVAEDAAWGESTVTWESAPDAAPGAITTGPVVAGSCYTVDVTDLIWNMWWSNQSLWAFRITSSQVPSSSEVPTDTTFVSREGGMSVRPQLIVDSY